MTRRLPHKPPSPPISIFAQIKSAFALFQAGKLDEAESVLQQILKHTPNQFDALHLLGILKAQTKQYDIALQLLDKAITLQPNNQEIQKNRRIFVGQYNQAQINVAMALLQQGRLTEAELIILAVLQGNPDDFDALQLIGAIAAQKENYHLALGYIQRALTIKPDYAEAHNNLGVVLKELKRLDEALASYGKAITIKPDYAEAHNNRGNALKELKRLGEALASYDKAITIKPDYAEAHNNRGVALKELKRLDEALASYDKAITIKPDYAEAHSNRGVALQELKRLDEALASCGKAIDLKPDFAEAYYNRGNALKELKRLDEASASYDKAIDLKPDYAEAHNNRGNALKELKRLNEALASYDKAITIKPDYAEAYNNRGNALMELKRLDEALASYDKAITIKPDYEFLFGTVLFTRMKLCDWSGQKDALQKIKSWVAQGDKVTAPFPLLGMLDDPRAQLSAARLYAEANYPPGISTAKIDWQILGRKTRIGYYSADFHNHATAWLMAELFEEHDREKFEIYGFSFGPRTNDEMRQRVSNAFYKFINVTDKSDREIATMSREFDIDIAIDLKGYTTDSRTGIFAERCAPIQVNYLGFPGTMGAPFIDYIIADETLIPEESRQYYYEKVVYLPHSYQVNDSKRKVSEKIFSRKEVGLPDSGFVFCCFNNNYKISPSTFDVWMRLLKAVEGSVLWLLEDNPIAAANLRKEARFRGVDESRLIFAKRVKLDEHLARHRLADLFLDTLPCNAHTTTSDALWAGLPVLTQIGQSFAARVSASLLNAIGLHELITTNPKQYESRAIELACNPEKLWKIRATLAQNRLTSPLFNGRLFARHIETAYTQMSARYRAGFPPDHIFIKPISIG